MEEISDLKNPHSIKNEYLSLSNTLDINFMIYPNPANDYINLKSESIIDGYIIYDIKGSLISEINK